MTLTCREVYGFLDEFVDGALDALTRRNFERHLEGCLSCRNYLATYRSTIASAREAEHADERPVNHVPTDLVKAILAARKASFVKRPPQ